MVKPSIIITAKNVRQLNKRSWKTPLKQLWIAFIIPRQTVRNTMLINLMILDSK